MSSRVTHQRLPPWLASLASPRCEPTSLTATPGLLSDEDLMLRVEKRDYAAVGTLFDRYASLIFGIGLRILRDRGEAEDLVQDVFLSLLERVKGFDPSKGSGRTWIVQIGYRRAFDRRAYLTRRRFYDGTDFGRIKNTLRGERDWEEQISDLVTGEQFHTAFEQLSEKQRATLEMYFFEGLDLREVSERLRETLENTRHFYYRGLEHLRRGVAALANQNGK